MGKNDVKLTLSRGQRRALDRMAKVSGLKTGPWARSVLLAMAIQPEPAKPSVAPEKQPLRPIPVRPAPAHLERSYTKPEETA